MYNEIIVTRTFLLWCVAVTFVAAKYLNRLLLSARRRWRANQTHPLDRRAFETHLSPPLFDFSTGSVLGSLTLLFTLQPVLRRIASLPSAVPRLGHCAPAAAAPPRLFLAACGRRKAERRRREEVTGDREVQSASPAPRSGRICSKRF